MNPARTTSDVVTGSTDAWAAVGGCVAARRTNVLGVTQSDLVGPGLSLTSIAKLEAGRSTRYRGSTIRALEDALGWERGSVQRVLEGGAPALRTAAETPDEHFERSSVRTAAGLDVDYVHRPNWTPERQIEFEEIVRRTADLIFGGHGSDVDTHDR
jgi:pimeloyl-ACP methyl ester carboxylesterase